ncbi:alpha/beta hydrolase [Serinicoccus kebangsaanensis]|uniref:alpha/beta hydrolase n=1 Tax=Serinicoccus kebangsaanensis TaxID=2602069 RepID=UPI00178C6214|nr:alpha/beta hydrolase [Serinicoccus kebangsaanensis]
MTTTSTRPVAWLPLVLGLAGVAVAAWVWLTRPGVLLAGHPSYLLLVTLVGVAGLALLALSLRPRKRAGGTRRGPAWLPVLARVVLVTISVLVLAAVAWLRPFSATPDAAALTAGTERVTVTDSSTRITLTPGSEGLTDGLVFQPGARVDPRAYLPVLTEVAGQGHLVVIVKQPLAVGFTALGAPGDIIADHPQVDRWSIGGHSLGGVAASAYAEEHPGEVDGLVLWAAYPIGDLSAREDLEVSTIFGSEDGLATPADIEASLDLLPPRTSVIEISGGVHAFFGDYGEQPGDGTPGVAREVAQDHIVRATLELLDDATAD